MLIDIIIKSRKIKIHHFLICRYKIFHNFHILECEKHINTVFRNSMQNINHATKFTIRLKWREPVFRQLFPISLFYFLVVTVDKVDHGGATGIFYSYKLDKARSLKL